MIKSIRILNSQGLTLNNKDDLRATDTVGFRRSYRGNNFNDFLLALLYIEKPYSDSEARSDL